MATYYIDDAGDGTTESSWATADTSMKDLDAEYSFVSGDIVYFGHDMQCQATHAATLTIVGPASGAPMSLISATQGSSPPTYQASTTKQIDTTEGNYNLIFDGAISLYGLSVAAGGFIQFNVDSNEMAVVENVRAAPGANKFIYLTTYSGGRFKNLHVDLSADGTTNSSEAVFYANGRYVEIIGLTFTNAGYRTGSVFFHGYSENNVSVSGADFSGFTNATACEIMSADPSGGRYLFSNCLTAATWTPSAGAITSGTGDYIFMNCGPANSPTYLYAQNWLGIVASTTAIYRTGGGTIESVACAWLVTTTATCSEGGALHLPWIYGTIASTGSKTFDVYITNDTADFTDADVWLEVEYLGTASEAQTALANDHRTITTTAAAQTDDTASTWNGSGPSFTYKQKLSATATVNQTGQFRARVCVGLASIASSRYFYVDPAVTVS